MLLAGDELGHSMGGNNNAYCQDNTTTWLNWAEADQNLVALSPAPRHPPRPAGAAHALYIHKPDEIGAASGFGYSLAGP